MRMVGHGGAGIELPVVIVLGIVHVGKRLVAMQAAMIAQAMHPSGF
jgi:hypothetical protein